MPRSTPDGSDTYRQQLDQIGLDTNLVDDPRMIERAGAWALCLAIREALEADQATSPEERVRHHESAVRWAAISSAAGQQLSGE